jgi:MFS family permease
MPGSGSSILLRPLSADRLLPVDAPIQAARLTFRAVEDDLQPGIVSGAGGHDSPCGADRLFAGLAGIFQAGIDLVFFDELMKTVPVKQSARFVSLAQSLQYLSMVAAPLLGTWLANHIGIGGALMVSALLRLVGFALFAQPRPAPLPDQP